MNFSPKQRTKSLASFTGWSRAEKKEPLIGLLDVLLIPPYSMFFILGLSFSLALITSQVQRRFVNLERVREVRTQTSDLRKQMLEARKKGDKKSYAKLQKRQQAIMKDSSKVMGGQMKVMLMTSLPFMAIFWILNTFFQTTIVAMAPFPLPYGALTASPQCPECNGMQLPFWVWYFLSSMAINMPINRIFRIYSTS